MKMRMGFLIFFFSFLVVLIWPPFSLAAACSTDPPLPAEGLSWPLTGVIAEGWSLDCQTDRGHRGIDISSASGTPVKASSSGIISFAGYTPAEGGGTTITIDHPGGLRTTYLHLTSSGIAKGNTVSQGQIIGFSTALPVHFGIKIYGGSHDTYFDPLDLLPVMTSAEEVQVDRGEQAETATATVPDESGLPAQSASASRTDAPSEVSVQPGSSTAPVADPKMKAPAASPKPLPNPDTSLSHTEMRLPAVNVPPLPLLPLLDDARFIQPDAAERPTINFTKGQPAKYPAMGLPDIKIGVIGSIQPFKNKGNGHNNRGVNAARSIAAIFTLLISAVAANYRRLGHRIIISWREKFSRGQSSN